VRTACNFQRGRRPRDAVLHPRAAVRQRMVPRRMRAVRGRAGALGPPARIRRISPEQQQGCGPRAAAEQAMNWLTDVLHNGPDPTETREWIESLKAVIDLNASSRSHQPRVSPV